MCLGRRVGRQMGRGHVAESIAREFVIVLQV
jgi:hypothetical protein